VAVLLGQAIVGVGHLVLRRGRTLRRSGPDLGNYRATMGDLG
jgi:hypothetical protein